VYVLIRAKSKTLTSINQITPSGILSSLKVSLIFFIIGCVWILLSGKIVSLVANDQADIARLEAIKGWFFITASAILIFILIYLRLKKASQQEEDFRRLIDTSVTGYSIIQGNEVVFRNKAQQKLLGPLPSPNMLLDFDNIHQDDVVTVKQFNQRIMKEKPRPLDTDFRLYPVGKAHIRSNLKWVHCRSSWAHYKDQEALLINFMDMTRAKELEGLLRIQDKMTSLGRMAAGIAHEIRNPLSGFNIYLDTLAKMLTKEDSIEKELEIIQKLKSASAKIESVIRRVMDFSKPSEPKFVKVDVNQPIIDALMLSEVTLRKSGIVIQKILSQNPLPCDLDSQMIEHVILNLITNAAEAMKYQDTPKMINITSTLEDDYVVVKVSDSGPGVIEDIKDNIIEPFYTTKESSSGIGLSICHRIITDHKGSLEVFASEIGGAEFKIKIPLERKF